MNEIVGIWCGYPLFSNPDRIEGVECTYHADLYIQYTPHGTVPVGSVIRATWIHNSVTIDVLTGKEAEDIRDRVYRRVLTERPAYALNEPWFAASRERASA